MLSAIQRILRDVASGALSPDDALVSLRDLPCQDIDWARIDHHRALRAGLPEVVFGEGKRPDQVVGIVSRMKGRGHPVLVTRLLPDAWRLCRGELDDLGGQGDYDPVSRTYLWHDGPIPETGAGTIVVACAGTSDLPVAEEAVRTARAFGNRVERVADVGVAGIHRLFACLPALQQARVIVAVAGMEGALPSVLAGLVSCPVVAVPTSVGYGASFGGLAALLAMLNSCAPGVTVVNVDNGFGAACAASLINHLPARAPDAPRTGAPAAGGTPPAHDGQGHGNGRGDAPATGNGAPSPTRAAHSDDDAHARDAARRAPLLGPSPQRAPGDGPSGSGRG